jgi:hypothetical protein
MVAVVDLALAILVAESIVLLALKRRHHLPVTTILLIALSGIGLLFALRTALSDGSALLMLAGLSLAGIAHGLDLTRRLRDRSTDT